MVSPHKRRWPVLSGKGKYMEATKRLLGGLKADSGSGILRPITKAFFRGVFGASLLAWGQNALAIPRWPLSLLPPVGPDRCENERHGTKGTMI
jgi:hypothetical protein